MLYLFDTEKSVGDRTAYEPRDGFRTRRFSAQHSVISEQPQFAKPADRRFRKRRRCVRFLRRLRPLRWFRYASEPREGHRARGFLLSSHNFSRCADLWRQAVCLTKPSRLVDVFGKKA